MERNCINISIVSYVNWMTKLELIYASFCGFVDHMERMDEVVLNCFVVTRTSERFGAYSRKKMDYAFGQLKNGKATEFSVTAALVEKKSETWIKDIAEIAVSIDPKNNVNILNVGYNETFLPNLCCQEEIVTRFLKLCIELVAVTGIVEKLAYVWGASGVTPMERQAVGFIDINKNYATKLRGYGFGNILTEAHITQLGGIEAIKKEAPCYMVQELNIGDKQALYLQLQDDIHKPDLENKMKLKQYLTPLLYPIDLLRLSANQRYIEWGVIPERDIYSGGLCLLEEEMDELMRLDALGREKITEMYDRRSKENIKSAQERKEQELLEKQRLAYKDIVLEITEDAYPEALPITIEFERITVKKKKAFERIITAWALTALNNGFSNEGAHDISGLMWENNRCCFQCDLGSGFEEILDALQRMLNWFCKTENLKVRLFTTQSFDKLE